MGSGLVIRAATVEDAQRIFDVHARSIRVLCGKDYSPAVIESWVRFRSARQYRDALASGNEENWAAVVDGVTVGYATGVGNELTALFVDPDHARCGAGKALLATFEDGARPKFEEVTLQSTLTSRGFYERRGYVVARPEAFTLPDGAVVDCLRMRKSLRGGI